MCSFQISNNILIYYDFAGVAVMAQTLSWSLLYFGLLSIWAQDFYEEKTGPTRVKTRGQKHDGQGKASLC